MMKRSAEEAPELPHKKHKHNETHRKNPNSYSSSQQGQFSSKQNGGDSRHNNSSHSRKNHHHRDNKQHTNSHEKPQPKVEALKQPQHHLTHSEALAQLPPPTSQSTHIPAYTHFTIPSHLPPLPPITSPHLTAAAFTHKSTITHTRSTSTSDISYERLEFLGDAYIELIASRLIFERFIHLSAGQQSQLRELLVKNETLAEYSRAYGFEKRLEVAEAERMMEDARRSGKGNKGFNKILGDVFEAYVAAVILSDEGGDGFAVAEKWLTGLWAPKLVEAAREYRGFAYNPQLELVHDEGVDLRGLYNPTAKQELQKRVLGFGVRLEYEKFKEPVELKGDLLGQNRHFIALFLTGYGYERKLLGKGEGKNKVEAGNWAATEAMHGECKTIVEECEQKLKVMRQEHKAKQAQPA